MWLGCRKEYIIIHTLVFVKIFQIMPTFFLKGLKLLYIQLYTAIYSYIQFLYVAIDLYAYQLTAVIGSFLTLTFYI